MIKIWKICSTLSNFSRKGPDSTVNWLRDYEQFNAKLSLVETADNVLGLLFGINFLEKRRQNLLDSCQIESFLRIYGHYKCLFSFNSISIIPNLNFERSYIKLEPAK